MRTAVLLGLAACLWTAASSQNARTLRLPCIADTNVSAHPSERGLNYGRSTHLRLKGHEMLALMKFDLAAARDWKIQKASLFVHAARPHMLRIVGISTVAVDWEEGTSAGQPADSGACFLRPAAGKAWGGPQSDLTDAVLTAAGTFVHDTQIQAREDGWLEADVDPRIVEAMADSRSSGMLLVDEKGQTQANNDIHSREQSGFAPYLIVIGEPGRTPEITPAAPPGPRREPLPAPLPLPPVERRREGAPPVTPGGLMAWAYPECEKVDAVEGKPVETGSPGDYRRSNAVWEGAARTIALCGARCEFVGFNLCLESAHLPSAPISIYVSELRGPAGASIPAASIRLYRAWYIHDGKWLPEVAVPLSGAVRIPDPANGIPGQQNQTVFGDLYVPPHSEPGLYSGTVHIRAGEEAIDLNLRLRVWDFTLPDQLSFDLDLNAYGPPGDVAAERAYHRMAHAHRATLNLLGYSQNGTVHSGFAPLLSGQGESLTISDWSEFDRRFGPYFDGSAFADLPRAGVPLRHAYLPFNEGWPSDIRRHYGYTPRTAEYPRIIQEHALFAPPIEDALDQSFRTEFSRVADQFVRHLSEKQWTSTEFQFYLNNKYFYKDPKQGGRGSSWWLLDEPMHRDDFLALGVFTRLFRSAAAGAIRDAGKGAPRVQIRADISRPQWQRDWLDGLLDLICVSGDFFTKNERCMALKRQQGITFWHYGTGNEIRESNLTEEAWALKAYLAGADGILPWNSVGPEESWRRPTPTTLLYSGRPVGIEGPVASLRLKALRRGQQDVEYLNLLARKRGWSRRQLAAAVSRAVALGGSTRQANSEDAGQIVFSELTSDRFAVLRRMVAAELTRKSPAPSVKPSGKVPRRRGRR